MAVLRQIAQLAMQLAIQTVGVELFFFFSVDSSATQYMDVFEKNVKTLVFSHSVEACFKN